MNSGIADRLEDNSVYSEDQDDKVDLSRVPVGTGLLLTMEQRAWGEGWGKGQQQADVRAALFMNREQGRNSHRFSPFYQRMNVSSGLAASFFFSFCLMFRLHFTSEQEGNSRNEFQFGVANTSGAPKAHEHVSREEMKSNNQELTTPLLWRGRPTLQVTHSEGC